MDELLELNINDTSVYRLNNVIKIAGTYTFSIWRKTNKSTSITLNVLGEKTQISSDTNWQKIVKTVTVDAVSESNNYIEISLDSGTIGYFYEAYLAEGKSDTSWSPAPEDVDDNMYQIKSEFTQTAEEIRGTVKDVDENVSTVSQKVNSVETEVKNARGDKTSLAVRIDGIQTEVSDNKKNISTVEQTASTLSTKVQSAEGAISQLKQDASGILTQVEGIEDDISRIDQKAGKIELSVGEVKKTADDANSKIDNLEVGGRNLALKSGVEYTNNQYRVSKYYMSPSEGTTLSNGCGHLVTGEKYMISICLTPSSQTQSISAYLASGYSRICSFIVQGTKKQIITAIATCSYATDRTPANNPEYAALELYRFPNVSGTTYEDITIHWVKVEKGNKATDWTPAPEDVDQGIKDAQDTANTANNAASNASKQAGDVGASLEILKGSISSLVVDENGQSMMTQKGDSWTFNFGSFKSALNQATQDITGVKGDIGGVEELANKTNQLANDLAQKTAYINMSTDENNKPCMELGKTDSEFKLRITNTSIDFMQGTQKIAYVSNQQLYIKSSVVTDEMQIGTDQKGFIWKMRANGNMGLRWKG